MTNRAADLVFSLINPIAEVVYSEGIADSDKELINKVHFWAIMASRVLCDEDPFIGRDKYQFIKGLLFDMAYNMRVGSYDSAAEIAKEAYSQIRFLRKQ